MIIASYTTEKVGSTHMHSAYFSHELIDYNIIIGTDGV